MTDSLPLTPLQHSMIVASATHPSAGLYVEQWIVRMRETVDVVSLQAAWRAMVRRHAILRTIINVDDLENPAQFVVSQVDRPWGDHDWRALGAAELAQRWEMLLADDRRRGFDFSTECRAKRPLWRITVARTAHDARFVCTYHHALLDGRSLILLGRELFARYDALTGAGSMTENSPAPDFADFVRALPKSISTNSANYWTETLTSRPPAKLPFDGTAGRSTSATDSSCGEVVNSVGIEETSELCAAAQQAGVTLHNMVQAAWALTLAAATGDYDHTFGSVRACRKSPVAGCDAMLGMLIHTVPFRARINVADTLRELLKVLRKQQTDLREHELAPPREIARCFDEGSHGALFDTVLMFTDQPATSMFEADGRPHPTRSVELRERSDGPLILSVESGHDLRLTLEHRGDVFDTTSARRLLNILTNLLKQFGRSLDRKLTDLTMLDEAGEREVVVLAKVTTLDENLPSLVATVLTQAERTPDSIALQQAEHAATYADLADLIDNAACQLREHGVGGGDRVVICSERSVEWVAAILAVWRVGAVYVPLDSKYPADRRNWILSNAEPKLLVVDQSFAAVENSSATPIVRLNQLFPDVRSKKRFVEEWPAADSPAVILYTSGSTGRPKGAVLTHDNLAAQNAAVRRAMDYTAGDRTTTLSSPCFDASLEEVFAPLCCGAALVLPEADVLTSHERLLSLAESARLTVLDMPTSLWRELTNYLADAGREFPSAVRALMTGGERATAATFAKFLRVGGARIRWFNAYGPTEATICATLYEHNPHQARNCNDESAPPIGRPIDGAVIALIDAYGRLVPRGAPGEVVIGGRGVGLGYWRRDDLTAERFIERPCPSLPVGRYYRTGDLARWNSDGDLEYLGRADGQIKLRGFRIEPAEIEAVVASHSSVRDVVVTVRTSPAGTEVLAAYVVPRLGQSIDVAVLQAHTAATLPEYMVPGRILAVEALPLTPNGKTDVARLPDPFSSLDQATFAVDREPTEIERRILDIWQTTLPGDSIRLSDDFFARGGDSLKAMTLASRLERELETKLPPNLLYRARTPEALARELATHDVRSELAPLIKLRGGRRLRPLFLIHSLGGDAWIYRHVIEDLPGDYAVFGLQIPGLDGSGAPADTIETAATEFLEHVRSVQPHGPYRLAGYSSGGLLALEMARKLEAAGERAEFIGLIDSGLPTKIENQVPIARTSRWCGFVRSVPSLVRELWSMPRDQRLRRVHSFLLRLLRRNKDAEADAGEALTERDIRECFAEDISVFSPERLELIRRHFDAIERYEPSSYAGDAHLFRSTRQPVFGTQSPTLGWERLIAGRLTVTNIFGAHAVLMKRPHATELANALDAALSRLPSSRTTAADVDAKSEIADVMASSSF
ncbi:MAG: amino acid adenylation domain-containing protein [Planctomycetes bacterium]|nr:amino acid adenylation domain-containing protein [Planctomycetota bacterium]